MPSARQKPAPQPTLKMWRLHRALTLEQVANIINKTAQTIHKWEAGKVPVTLDNLQLLAQAYGITAAQLLFSPDDVAMEAAFRRAHAVLTGLDADRATRWLQMGEDLAQMPPLLISGLESSKKS